MPADDDLLRTSELAELFHVSPKAVTRYAQHDGLPFLWTPGGHRRYPYRPAMDWFELRLEAAKQRNEHAYNLMNDGQANNAESRP